MGQRFFPLDKQLGLLSGRHTPRVQETLTRLGSRMTYREAQEEMALMWRINLSPTSIRECTLINGRIAEQLIQAKVADLQANGGHKSEEAGVDKLVMSADGAMVQTTTGDWREVKTVAFGECETTWNDSTQEEVVKTTNVSYFSQVAEATNFGEAALYEWDKRNGENANQVVAVNDGAVWIQAFIDYHAPKATRILDLPHALEYVAQIGKLIYGTETEKFKEWFAEKSKLLRYKPPERLLGDLTFLIKQHEEHPDIHQLEHALSYLQKRKEMIDYPHFRSLGLPIGSGMVESGHKVVMQRRMKQAGMRWAEENLNPMLALRSALCNRRWGATWNQISTDRQAPKSRPVALGPSHSVDSSIVSEKDVQRLSKFAKKQEEKAKKKKGWTDHKWIFPHRANFSHQN